MKAPFIQAQEMQLNSFKSNKRAKDITRSLVSLEIWIQIVLILFSSYFYFNVFFRQDSKPGHQREIVLNFLLKALIKIEHLAQVTHHFSNLRLCYCDWSLLPGQYDVVKRKCFLENRNRSETGVYKKRGKFLER